MEINARTLATRPRRDAAPHDGAASPRRNLFHAARSLQSAARAYDAAPMARETESADAIAAGVVGACVLADDLRVYAESAEQDAAEMIERAAGCETPAARWFALIAAACRYEYARRAYGPDMPTAAQVAASA